MVSRCALPFYTNRYSKGSKTKSYKLPLKNKKSLKAWLARRCESLPVNAKTRICSEHLEGKAKKGNNGVTSFFVWTKKAKGRTTRKPQSNLGQCRWTTECFWVLKPSDRCLTEPSASNSNTDEILWCISASMQSWSLADVAVSRSKSELPSSSEDCHSSLEMLAEVCE